MIIVFVILHYGSADVTQRAIESIFSLERGDCCIKIVVVDNASPNQTGCLVEQRNEMNEDLFFLKNKENLGFAKGNNIGFAFAKNELKADFIILMNNDALIESVDFCKLVMEDYQTEKFAVLGPYIHTPNGKNQNPLRKNMLKGFRLKLTQVYLWLDLLMTWLFVAPFVSKSLSRKRSADAESLMKGSPMNDVELHGSFLIFSPLYIQKFDGLDDRTFMYCEEEFLFARCVLNNLVSRYNPNIKVFHNEIETSHSSLLAKRRKALFRIQNCLKSLTLYSGYLKGNP